MTTIIRQQFAIEGMSCQGCVKSVTGAISMLPGVETVDVSLERKSATVGYDAASLKPAAILAAIEAAGFEARAD